MNYKYCFEDSWKYMKQRLNYMYLLKKECLW